MSPRTSVRVVLLVGAALATVHAQSPRPSQMPGVDPTLLKGLQYRLVGTSRGGRVTAVTGVPAQPRTFYMGVASGGVFKTTDNGVAWTPISDGQIPLGSIGAIAVSNSDPNIVYVGTGSDGVRSNVSTGRGIYKSTDAGKTWTFVGLYSGGQTGGLRIHPSNPDVVWAAMTGDIFKPNDERGVFKTIDGGKTWKKTLFIDNEVGAMDVELQPNNPDVVYAWMSKLERKPWTIISGGKLGGFYKSTNGGETFTKITTGLPNDLIGKANLAVTAAKPDRIYALVEAKPGGGFYRSDDSGQTWANTGAPANIQSSLTQRPFYYTTIGADPTNADVVYAGAEGFFKSTDAGKTFATMRTPHGDNHDIWINPKDGNIMVQANDGGANVSIDGGRTWSTQMNQVTSEIYGVWMDNEFPYRIYGAQQDNSTLMLSSTADPFDTTFRTDTPGCETGPVMPHPTNPDVVYGSCKGQYEVKSMTSNWSRNYWVGAQSLYGNAGQDLILRFQRVSPMATSPHDPEILYYGSQKLHRTRDKGVTWETLSGDLTAFPKCCQGASGEPITRDVTGEEFYSTLYAISESPLEKGVIWTGANDGPFHVTRDNGKKWVNITPKDLPEGARVAWIDASPHRKGSAYFAVYRYLMGDYAPYIYRTDDYGATWTKLTDGRNGIKADEPTRVVREDPGREGLLYAGTEFGMYISFNNGANWQSFQLNMPNVPINDIKIHKGDLVIATQGRAIWSLDNLTSLHQMTPAVTPTAPFLFKPRDGYRTRTSPALLGPMIEYHLPAEPAGPVTIEILDAKGGVINSYNSNAPAAGGGGRGGRGGGGGANAGAPPDPDAAMGEGRPQGRGGGAAPARVTKNAGRNRFVWDARHQNGLSATPGAYQARLKFGETTLTQPFNLLIDPRLAKEGLTVADLQEQFDHNVKMRELTAAATQLLQRLTEARKTFAADPVKLEHAEVLRMKLVDEPVRYGKPGFQTHIRYLGGMTGGEDQKIGRDAIERYNVLKKDIDQLKAEVDKLTGGGQ